MLAKLCNKYLPVQFKIATMTSKYGKFVEALDEKYYVEGFTESEVVILLDEEISEEELESKLEEDCPSGLEFTLSITGEWKGNNRWTISVE